MTRCSKQVFSYLSAVVRRLDTRVYRAFPVPPCPSWLISLMAVQYARDYVFLILTMLFWGGSWVSGKLVVDTAPPFTIGFFRFLVASALLLPAAAIARPRQAQKLQRRTVFLFFLMGLVGIFGYGIFFLVGMRFTTAAQGSIIAGINPASVSLWAHIMHKEHLDRKWRYGGFAVSFFGIIFVVGVQALIDFQPEYVLGNLLIICAMMTWGFYSSVGKSAMKNSSSIEATAASVAFGTLIFSFGATYEQFWTLPAMANPAFWFNILFLAGPVTFLGYIFYFIAIKDIGATRSAVFINLVPVFGVSLSVLLLHEVMYWTFGLGLLLVIAGIMTITFPLSRKSHIHMDTTLPLDSPPENT